MKKGMLLVIVIILILTMACTSHTHYVGKGPQIGTKINKRQWYIMFGIIPLNSVDTDKLAGGATDYQITTRYGASDWFLNLFTAWLTVSSRSVTVVK